MSFQFDHHSPQLFFLKKGSSGPPEPLASSVLVKINSFFLLTANHVFENKTMDEVVIFTNADKIVRLYGEIGFYLPVAGVDNIDIAVLKLPEELAKDLSKRYRFLHYNEIAFAGIHKNISEFMIYAFIAHQTELDGRVFESNQFGLLTHKKKIPINDPSGFKDQEHLWLNYHRRKQSFIDSSERNIGPKDLRGLSGGGVWAIIQQADVNRPPAYRLAGIMTEQRVGRGFIIASRANMLIGILHYKFGLNPATYLHFS